MTLIDLVDRPPSHSTIVLFQLVPVATVRAVAAVATSFAGRAVQSPTTITVTLTGTCFFGPPKRQLYTPLSFFPCRSTRTNGVIAES